MITAACPHPQTVRSHTTYRIPEQSTSSPEHAGALGPAYHEAMALSAMIAFMARRLAEPA